MKFYKSIIDKVRQLHQIRNSKTIDSPLKISNQNLTRRQPKVNKKRAYIDCKNNLLDKDSAIVFSEYKNIQLSRYK